MIDEETFRRVMGHFSTGVTVVASRDPRGEPVGLTVNAFTSVSLDPPLVLVCLHKNADAHDPLLASGHFGVSVLRGCHADLAVRFSSGESERRFEGLETRDGPLGSPLISDALAWMECRIEQVHSGGDHSIIVGEVTSCGALEGDPLLFFRGALSGKGS